jgi:hypothetical protein
MSFKLKPSSLSRLACLSNCDQKLVARPGPFTMFSCGAAAPIPGTNPQDWQEYDPITTCARHRGHGTVLGCTGPPAAP